MIKTFQVGQTYAGRIITDADASVSFTVAGRTGSFITTTEGKRLGISKKLTAFHRAETVQPWGSYSMAPQVHA